MARAHPDPRCCGCRPPEYLHITTSPEAALGILRRLKSRRSSRADMLDEIRQWIAVADVAREWRDRATLLPGVGNWQRMEEYALLEAEKLAVAVACMEKAAYARDV